MKQLLSLVLLSCAFLSSSLFASPPKKLVIYTYDSFVAKGGLGPEIIPIFEKKCACRVELLASGDANEMVTRIQLDAERGRPAAQIALGLDQVLWERAKPWLETTWQGGKPRGWEKLDRLTQIAEGFVPFDFGFFAFMSDQQELRQQGLKPLTRLRDLLKPEWRRKFLLEDPRTSSPGLGFVLFAQKLLGRGFPEFAQKMRGQWLTLTPGWTAAYGLFLKREAPLVWSYTTSQAYHRAHGDSKGRYQALLFEEGQPIQVEGAAVVKGAVQNEEERKLALAFLDFLISEDVQAKISERNWMYPARKGTLLPRSFEGLPRPKRVISIGAEPERISETLKSWEQSIGGWR